MLHLVHSLKVNVYGMILTYIHHSQRYPYLFLSPVKAVSSFFMQAVEGHVTSW
jgi:hypothetical protein